MFTRRRFLSYGGTRILAIAAGCKPENINGLLNQEETASNANPSLAEKAKLAKQKNFLLGYPINMNTPPPAFFAFPANNTWGFLSHSGTDSNMHEMYMERTILKDAPARYRKPISLKKCLISVQILRDLLGLETVFVATLSNGGRSWLITRLIPLMLVKYCTNPGLTRQSYVMGSIAVSCHKFFGFPASAGLFITTKSHFDEFNELFSQIHNSEYIHPVPGKITCSRDAVKPTQFYFFSKY